MNDLTPFEILYEGEHGQDVPLPVPLRHLYGRLRLPLHAGRPYVMGNFVTTLDGVVSLNVPGKAGGGEISGFNQHDRLLMGLLRALSDVVIVGAGTLRSVPQHLWTADYIYPPLADAYAQLRAALGKPEPPLNVIVTGRGALDLSLRVFRSGEVPVMIVTTHEGARSLEGTRLPRSVKLAITGEEGSVSARAILAAVGQVRQSEVALVEGGPQLMGDFFAESCLEELFLTLAPQVAGRDGHAERPGLVAGRLFGPDHPLWGQLLSVRRAQSHLFLRYRFESTLAHP